ncbi:DUF2829 domain-containing protein [Escherichia coli]|nr:DUF2829 domain-containing protein [Escherichia coli]EII3337752.1 DUF2829 domain-containing protein [Escherichia coli]
MNNMTTKELLTALPKYKSHKTVRASKIKDIEIIALMDVVLFCNIEVVEPEGVKVHVDKIFLQKHRPEIGGYLVAYEDGSLSYSPEKTFEEGLSRTNDFFENGVSLSIEGHNGVTFITARDVTISAGGIATLQEEIDLEAADFSDALMWLKDGKKVARRGWNGENQFCWLVPEGQYPARMEAIKGYFPGDLVPYGAYFALKNAQGVVVPWVPSVGDLLACDWFVVE